MDAALCLKAARSRRADAARRGAMRPRGARVHGLMDLLEYQGKQLFARHGVPVPSGKPATTVDEAVAAAEEIGYPVRGQGAGADRRPRQGRRHQGRRTTATRPASTPTNIIGMDIRGFTVHEVWIEAASDIASEYYASIIFDRSAKKPLVMLSTQGGMDIEEVAERDPDAIAKPARRPAARLPGLPRPPAGLRRRRRRRRRPPRRRAAVQALRRVHRRGRDARRGQPADRHDRPRGRGARRQGHARRQRALPPPRPRRAARHRAARTRRSRWPASAA